MMTKSWHRKLKSCQLFHISSEITNVSVTVGSQKSETTTKTSSTEAVASNVTAGGNVNITATGGGKDSNVNITGSNISGDKSVTIKADNDVNITSAQSTSKEESSNKSSGWSAGVTAGVSAGGSSTGVSVTGSVNSGSGQSKGESVTQLNSNITSNGTTKIESGGTTTIAGGQVSGNSAEVDAKELKIESKQDTATYDSKQKNVSVGVSVNVTGIGGSANVSANKSNVSSDYASVNQQSGIIAGDGGYKVTVKENTDLKGGIITSTQKAEDEGKNSVTTGTLTSSDIQNKAEHKGTAIGINGSVGVNRKPGEDKTTGTQPDVSGKGVNVGKSVGFGSDKDKQTSTTNSGINTNNLTITDAEKQAATGKTVEQIKSEVKTNTTSDNVDENSGKLENTFDKDKVQKELDLQVAVTQEFDKNSQEVKTLINKKIEEKSKTAEALHKKAHGKPLTSEEQLLLDKYAKENSIDVNQLSGKQLNDLADKLDASADKWQNSKVLFDSITGALSSGNIGGTIAQGVSPYVAQQIGQYFKDKDAQGSAGHLLAHAVLGAAVAAAGGDNAVAGGLSGTTSEAVSPLLTKWLFKQDDPSKLTAEQKETISSIVGLIGTGIGATLGDSSDAVTSGNIAQTAFDDNLSLFDKNKNSVITKPLTLKPNPRNLEEEPLDSLYRQVAERLAEDYHVDVEYVLQMLKQSGYTTAFLTWNGKDLTEEKLAEIIKSKLINESGLATDDVEGKTAKELIALAEKNEIKLDLGSFQIGRNFRDGVAEILSYQTYEKMYAEYEKSIENEIKTLKASVEAACGRGYCPPSLLQEAQEKEKALRDGKVSKENMGQFLGILEQMGVKPELADWTADQKKLYEVSKGVANANITKIGLPALEFYAEWMLPIFGLPPGSGSVIGNIAKEAAIAGAGKLGAKEAVLAIAIWSGRRGIVKGTETFAAE